MLNRKKPHGSSVFLEVLSELSSAVGPELEEELLAFLAQLDDFFHGVLVGCVHDLLSGFDGQRFSARVYDQRAALAYLVSRSEAYNSTRCEGAEEEVELVYAEHLVARAGQVLIPPTGSCTAVLQQCFSLVELLVHVPLHLEWRILMNGLMLE